MTEYLCVFEDVYWPCMSKAALLSNGFIGVGSICHSADYFMRDTEAIQNLKSILRGTLRIITDDNRAFIGTFVGTDKSLNILLLNTEEFRLGADANPAGRYVGQVMIPWRLIRGIGLQVAGQGDGMSDSEQVRVCCFRPTNL
jgi:small nuclear ribonucleoprotein (snRNP)-like protein